MVRFMEIKEIRSSQNETYKLIKSLKDKKGRDSSGMFFIEGSRFVDEALETTNQIEWLLYSEKYQIEKLIDNIQLNINGSLSGLKILTLPEKLFDDLCNTDNPQGIAAVIKTYKYDIQNIIKTKKMFLILDRIQDPGNMGTMIRTADAAGFDAVIMSEGCVDIYNPKVLRATMGSIFHVPVVKSDNILATIESMKNENISIYAADLKGDKSLFEESFSYKTAIITGNEANGISQVVLDSADVLLNIPMAGCTESLNASIAGGILLYEVFRKRGSYSNFA